MSGRICILTPDPADRDFGSRWRERLAIAAAPLEAAGIAVEGRSWAGAGDLGGFDLVLPLFVWGYQRAHAQWLQLLDEWQEAGARLMNPAPVLRWNSDKSYLGALEGKGAPVVPTIFVDGLTQGALEEALDRFGTDRLVAKPQISASAWRTIRWSPGEPFDGGPEGPAMIQPYLPNIETVGEVSIIYLGGRFSHAVDKRPQLGDFRVQTEYDGIISAYSPPADEFAAAEKVLAAIEEELLYARVDLVRGSDGEPCLIEIELIEPDLYLGYNVEAPRNFATAILELIGR